MATGTAHSARAHESAVVNVMLVGQDVKTGLMLSVVHGLTVLLTVTVNEHVDEFPAGSVAV